MEEMEEGRAGEEEEEEEEEEEDAIILCAMGRGGGFLRTLCPQTAK
jgi:hypothetical protein